MNDRLLSRDDFVLAPTYGRVFDDALKCYFECCALVRDGSAELSTGDVNMIFWQRLKHLGRNSDPHLVHGLFRPITSNPPTDASRPYRPTLITRRLMQRSGRIEGQILANRQKLAAARKKLEIEDDSVEVLFSPLFFLRQYLTDPEYTASDAYAHYVIRAHIFSDALKFKGRREGAIKPDPDSERPFDKIRRLIRFESVVKSLQKIERHWKIDDNVAPTNATDFIVMHLLASRGYLVLRFGEKWLRDRRALRISREQFVSGGSLLVQERRTSERIPTGYLKSSNIETYEFRVLPEVARLPLASEIINEIDGLPMAIPGSDTVLYRGLRFQEDSGVVLRLSGRTGTGKTSVALGLAVSLAPLGTRTVYLSCEEERRDLQHRIQTLIPQNLRRTTAFHQVADDWFSAEFVIGDRTEKYEKVENFLAFVRKKYEVHIQDRWSTPPGTIPLLIVIDGVHEILDSTNASDYGPQARTLIERCRATGSIVLILSAKNDQAKPDELDYLVDFVAGLDYAPSKDSWERPVRTLAIQKTRRQSSRVGTHVLHISGRQGLRIAPQVAAQLDQRRDFKWIEPSTEHVFDFLIRPKTMGASSASASDPLVQIFERSQILVTGVGSGGKSAFGLKLLTTSLLSRRDLPHDAVDSSVDDGVPANLFESIIAAPEPEVDEEEREQDSRKIDAGETWFESIIPNRRKILILSFLYQEDYYRKLWKRINRYRKEDAFSRDSFPRVSFDVHSFSPGYLRPEDFLTIITQMLDQHELEGWPYDGVLIDGLHNVYLQFPYLEQSEMVWPMLFQMLRTRGLTVVTTHTYFTIDPGADAQRLDADDVDSARRRAAPLLHALVQATDFRVRVTPEKHETAQRMSKVFVGFNFDTRVDVLGAIGQPIKTTPMYWDRNHGVVIGVSESEMERVQQVPTPKS